MTLDTAVQLAIIQTVVPTVSSLSAVALAYLKLRQGQVEHMDTCGGLSDRLEEVERRIKGQGVELAVLLSHSTAGVDALEQTGQLAECMSERRDRRSTDQKQNTGETNNTGTKGERGVKCE